MGMCIIRTFAASRPSENPYSGAIYALRSKRADRMKLLWWDGMDANTAHHSRDVLRMMDWTQTGVVCSIKSRDKRPGRRGARLKQLDSAYNYLDANIPAALNRTATH
jgi:hypothetical protein